MATALDTNLSVSPYFDDFDTKSQYYRILFKPGYAVQTRELNQIQSMLQDQIDKMGRSIYKEGSVVEGVVMTFDNKRAFVKVNDTFTNSSAFTISDFVGQTIVGANGLKALVTDATAGFLSQAPATNVLYVKYLNSASYPNTSPQTTYDTNENLQFFTTANVAIGNVAVASNTTNNIVSVTGYGYAMNVTEGIIFKNGTFLYVTPQQLIVDAFDNQPDDLSVGFYAPESVVTAQSNSALFDNAAGSPNFTAPGADRLKIVPELVIKATSDVSNTTAFFSLVDFKNGGIVTLNQTAAYSGIGVEFARRTYETNGNFVVNPFILTTKNLANTSDPAFANNVNLFTSSGIGYVNGYRVEYINGNSDQLRKGVDFANVSQQVVTANFGYYVPVDEVAGEFNSATSVVQVELHSAAKTAVSGDTRLAASYSAGTKIGSAYVRGFAFDSGTPGMPDAQYRMYLFDVVMNAGQNFSNVRSIINYSSGIKGVADVVLTYNATLQANIASILETFNNGMVFPFGQRAIKTDGFSHTEYIYRRKTTSSFANSSGGQPGNCSITIPTATGGVESFPFSGTLSSDLESDFYIVPTADGATANLSGTVSVSNASNTVTGSGTSFLSNFVIGDYITVSGNNNLITSIVNSTSMSVAVAFPVTNASAGYAKGFPAGAMIPLSNRSNRSVVINSSNTATVVLGDVPLTTLAVDVFFDVLRANTVPIRKVIARDRYVQINCNTNSGGFTGPWCLGLPDVYQITQVLINSDTNDSSSYFTLDNGQRDTHYDLANLVVKPSTPASTRLTANSTILVKLDHFTLDSSQGVGFFTGNSYPIDDVNGSANTNAIETAQIPQYTTTKGTVFDLRDCVDFRPVATNTAVSNTSSGSATVNPSSTLTITDANLPSPDSNFQSDLEYYLQRTDRASLDTNGNLVITEGTPAVVLPAPPPETPGTMTLGLISVPPYPSLSSDDARAFNRFDYAITIALAQNRRYTMADIKVLDNRITNLEYYTSLSLLEQSAASLLIKSSTTGQNRFQNGIFADHFQGFNLCNTIDPQFRIAIDGANSILRPAFMQRKGHLVLSPSMSSNVVQHGDLTMLNHTSNNVFISQPYASKFRNCVEGNVFQWNGSIVLVPPSTVTPDISVAPTIINNLDLASNFLNLVAAWGTQWGNWVTTAVNSSTNSSTSQDTSTNPDGSQQITTTTQNVTTTQTQQTQTGKTLQASPVTTTELNLGNFVTNISILPYLPSTLIRFEAHGMKPSTRVYAYFGNTPVSNYCAPASSAFAISAIQGQAFSGIPGDPLVTDTSGSVYGFFLIPGNTFQSQDNTFLLTDISDLTQGADAVQTQASVVFYGSNLSYQTGQSILNTQSTTLSVQEVTQQQTLLGQSSNTQVTVQYIPAPPAPPPAPYDPPPWYGDGDEYYEPAGDSPGPGCGDPGCDSG